MKQKTLAALFLLLIMVIVSSSGCAPGTTEAPPREIPIQIIKDITPREALALIENNRDNPNFIIIDVRTAQEVADGHIEKAINIDFYSKTFREELSKLDRNKTYLVYCRSGSRSFNSAKIMEELKFRKVYNMLDGIIRWRAEGLPIIE